MSKITPQKALNVLKSIKEGNLEALYQVPGEKSLASELTHLSDVAACVCPQLAVIAGSCNKEVRAKAFSRNDFPLEDMGDFALHMATCLICRTAVANLGIRPLERSTELLRHTLNELTKA